MSHIAEFSISSPKLALAEARRAAPDVVIEVEQEVGTDPERPLFFFRAVAADGADEGVLDDFDAALRADPTVTDEVVLDRLPGERLYRVQLSDDLDVVLYPVYVDLGAELLDLRGDAEEWRVRMRFPDRDALASFRQTCLEHDLDFDLRRLYDETDDAGARAEMTSPQREAVAIALREGYFDVPREASLEDVAAELDVSAQSASERIRRGMRALARDAFGDGDEGDV